MINMPITLANPFTFRMSLGEHGFREVLETFGRAQYVTIVTYNFETSEDSLLIKALENIKSSCKLRIFYNLPKRWETYKYSWNRDQARKQIREYHAILDFDALPEDTRLSFCPKLHAKIVMTDLLAYIGSANFSEGSAAKIEAGFIISDPLIIETIRAQVIPALDRESIPRIDRRWYDLVMELVTVRGSVTDFLDSLNDQCLILFDDYVQSESWGLLPERCGDLNSVLDQVEAFLTDVEEAINLLSQTSPTEDIANILDSLQIESLLELLAVDNPLRDFTTYDHDEAVIAINTENPPGDEETFDEDLARADEEATLQHEAMIPAAEEALKDLLAGIERLGKDLARIVETVIELHNGEETIDNT